MLSVRYALPQSHTDKNIGNRFFPSSINQLTLGSRLPTEIPVDVLTQK
jgi:hypothetical protein